MPPDPPPADPNRPAAALARLAVDPGVPLPELFRRACEAAADALGVERAGVWLLVNDHKLLRCVSLFERSSRRHGKGATLPVGGCPAYLRAVAAAPAVACRHAPDDPRTAELRDAYLGPLGITSLLDAGLVRDGRLVGVVCYEHVGPPRDWADADRAFARGVADLLVERMRAAEDALRARVPTTPGLAPAVARPAPGLAHDFRTALSEVLANAELIARTPDLPAEVPDRVDRITAAATRGVGLLRGLLAVPAADDTREHTPLPPV